MNQIKIETLLGKIYKRLNEIESPADRTAIINYQNAIIGSMKLTENAQNNIIRIYENLTKKR